MSGPEFQHDHLPFQSGKRKMIAIESWAIKLRRELPNVEKLNFPQITFRLFGIRRVRILSDHGLKSDSRLICIAFSPIRVAAVEASARLNFWVNRRLSKGFRFTDEIAVILRLYRRVKQYIDDLFPGGIIKLQ